ncbi:ATP-binding cassette domain-containing protein [Labrys wisconsinensis]|uniref:Alpha-D-ribose 1-methylphosphonate 5-triphosphate synthase subunit PhnL n=1 Tax=Labrys wisconsinensis TaxID=425677 RepID=A0ABU0JFJ8_9HYPH|nr:ATP-binding cassette domain-containing protein [Labrys wisconsinensis]MDQ0473061.1 alpha-D-ribose 1-methylphosphonate 5-triphosphate synthase subunit PhnL [Labrys wisconsinensis]
MPRPVLEVEDLAKHFDIHHLEQRVFAFEGVSFRLCPGQFLLVRGRNGAGKSTLLRTLYRTYVPKGGRIWFEAAEGRIDLARAADVDVAALRQRDIGFVTQFLVARPRVAADEIVAEALRRAGWARAEALDEAHRRLDEFGVKRELWRAYPSTFSGGEQQKVNLARALVLPQRLLLLDEPTASLDAGARHALIRRLGALKAEGVAMIGVFHHPEDVAELIDTELTLAS